LCKPSGALESLEVDSPPVRKELVTDIAVEVRVLPLGTAHDVEVLVATHVRFDPDGALNLGVDIRVVRDVADVENTERSSFSTLELLQPGGPFVRLRDHVASSDLPATLEQGTCGSGARA